MTTVSRVLDPEPVDSFAQYREAGGGTGLEASLRLGGTPTIEEILASGLRGRGGAGFPTGIKWRTVVENRPDGLPLAVVVNAAEGEPGSFKDRELLRRNPYRVLEGALIAAHAIGADSLTVATKASFRAEWDRISQAIDEVTDAGWCEGLQAAVVGGPSEYLYGEETALLEALAGRGPFPRIAPPYRRGIDPSPDDATSAGAQMAAPGVDDAGEPVLVNNVETMAHVAQILANGPDWFREMGTGESPGTIVCTISGDVRRSGVAEVPMGTPLDEVIHAIGDGPRPKRSLRAALSGVANPLLPAERFGTPLTYEDMKAAGAGLGAAGFIVIDDGRDLVSVVEGISRFLSVESCGQCTPCKKDGMAITGLLGRLRRRDADDAAMVDLTDRVRTVTEGARCYLASQHQFAVQSLLELFPDDARAARSPRSGDEPVAAAMLVAPLVDIVDGQAVLEDDHAHKQPDWTYGDTDSGQTPAERIDTTLEA